MTLSLQYTLLIVACMLLAVQADVSHLAYNRYNANRNAPLRLQRLESRPTPYPSAGYRPNREFNLPREQPLFPLANTQQQQTSSSGFDNLSEPQHKPQLVYGAPAVDNQRFPQQQQQNSNGFNNFAEHSNTQQQQTGSSGFDNLSEPQQKPQVIYNAPSVDSQRFPQQQQQQQQPAGQRPQNSNGFNNLAETQPQDFNVAAQNQEFENANGFNNLAEPQQRPELLYAAPNNPNGFDNLAEPQQRPQYNYNSPARLRQLLIASLQQARAQLQNQPQNLYSAPANQQPQQSQQIESQAQAESQPSRLTAAKPARLTDNREDREEETAESALDIETTTKKDSTAQNATNGTAVAANPVAAPANGLVAYYPATAFTYVAAANYPAVQPVNAAYAVGTHFLPQQYAFAAAPAQLQAW